MQPFEFVKASGTNSDPELQTTLQTFADLIHRQNKQHNLTGLRSPEDILARLIDDSLRLVPFVQSAIDQAITEGKTPQIVDIGSGAGIPCIPLAVALPTAQFVAIEATAKKARFIDLAIDSIGVGNLMVVSERSETLAHDAAYRERFHLATARAVGELSSLLELSLPFLKLGGTVIFPKGPSVFGEMTAASIAAKELGARLQTPVALPKIDGLPETILVFGDKLEPTPGRYPRRPGIPAHQPLGY